jgi:hypothetical protein
MGISKLLVAWIALSFLPVSLLAKRAPPAPVVPVTAGEVRYSADGDGRDQYVIATDTPSNKVLWKVRVFHNQIDERLEEDVQWVFITKLKLQGKSLLVKDEKSRCYSVDLTSRQVKRQACGIGFLQ